jgi:hypothetical protein
MSKFPLYDSMIKGTPKTDLTIKNKQEFSKLVQQMDTNGYELIYALIRMYQIENNDAVEVDIQTGNAQTGNTQTGNTQTGNTQTGNTQTGNAPSGNGKLPYEGIFENGNVHFDLEKLPNKLKHLIFKFLNAHIQKMNDDVKKC